MRKKNNSSVVDVCKRELGQLSNRNFAHRFAASKDLVLRLDIVRKLDKHRTSVNTISFNAAGDVLVSGSDDRRIILWDWETGREFFSFHSSHCGSVSQAKFMPYTDDRCIITCGADGQVRCAQILEGGKLETRLLAKFQGPAHKLFVEPGSPHCFYTCGEDGAVQHAYKGCTNYETAKDVSFLGPKCEYVLSGSDCGRIFIWKKNGGELIRVIKADRHAMNCFESHPRATVLASSGIERDIKIWSPEAIDRAVLSGKFQKDEYSDSYSDSYSSEEDEDDDDDDTDSEDDSDGDGELNLDQLEDMNIDDAVDCLFWRFYDIDADISSEGFSDSEDDQNIWGFLCTC